MRRLDNRNTASPSVCAAGWQSHRQEALKEACLPIHAPCPPDCGRFAAGACVRASSTANSAKPFTLMGKCTHTPLAKSRASSREATCYGRRRPRPARSHVSLILRATGWGRGIPAASGLSSRRSAAHIARLPFRWSGSWSCWTKMLAFQAGSESNFPSRHLFSLSQSPAVQMRAIGLFDLSVIPLYRPIRVR